jgi:hypothetical protein
MDHLHPEQSYSEEILKEMPEVHETLAALHIEGSHNRLTIQAEAAGVETDVVMAMLEIKLRKMAARPMGERLN